MHRLPTLLCTALAVLLGASTASAVPAERSAAELKAGVVHARAAALPPGGFGNGIFQVHLQQRQGFGIGGFTVLTGPDHPAGPGLNVLFGDGVPGTSFMTVRNLVRREDNVQSPYLTQPGEVSLDDRSPRVVRVGPTSSRVTWSVYTTEASATVTQDIVVHGTTVADSSVEVTTGVDGATADTFQVQYLWDVANGRDDGPVIQQVPEGGGYRPFATPVTTEQTFTGANSFAAADNDRDPAAPTSATGFTGAGPSRVTPTPTPPESVKYACWPRAVGAPFGSYRTDPTVDVSTSASDCTRTGSGADSALLYLFPRMASGARVTASLFATPTTPYPTALSVAPVRVGGSPSLAATLTDTTAGRPVPGRAVTFAAGSRALCTAVTGADGVAACGGAAEGLAALLGYSATYAGGAIWAATSGRR
ncbi:hypothetical protein [Saccharothrix obliqua]|uniref:hypothetical protein n=1 Tax=Saccharothrix obliqua TaxID=2861747 RepID=UPI001C5E85CE|nr:hypothetical protein [Saccharothrix obliqua]MBW4717799.1 hypothetical protein [Saccharothrix obliqua]